MALYYFKDSVLKEEKLTCGKVIVEYLYFLGVVMVLIQDGCCMPLRTRERM